MGGLHHHPLREWLHHQPKREWLLAFKERGHYCWQLQGHWQAGGVSITPSRTASKSRDHQSQGQGKEQSVGSPGNLQPKRLRRRLNRENKRGGGLRVIGGARCGSNVRGERGAQARAQARGRQQRGCQQRQHVVRDIAGQTRHWCTSTSCRRWSG